MQQEYNRFEKLALRATKNIGSPFSILAHTVFFVGIFSLHFFNVNFNDILLILTTVVSLEAIYLSIFIQLTININTARLTEVSEDVEEIQEDVGEIQEDVGEIQENVEGLEEDVKELSLDVGEITEEMEEDQQEANVKRSENREAIEKVESAILKLLKDLENLKDKNNSIS